MKKRLKIILRILLGMFLAIAGLLILAYIFASEDTQYEYSPEKREVVETMIDVSSNKAYRTKIQDATSGRLGNAIRKVVATGYDTENIESFTRELFHVDNSDILDIQITPGNINYAYLTIPHAAGEYGASVSVQYKNKKYDPTTDYYRVKTLVYPVHPNVPSVIVTADKKKITLGETVNFEVIAKILSGEEFTDTNEEFLSERIFKYDFDEDGQRDLITGSNQVSHTYDTLTNYTYFQPKVEVEYKGYKGLGKITFGMIMESPNGEYRTGIRPTHVLDSYIGNIRNILPSHLFYNSDLLLLFENFKNDAENLTAEEKKNGLSRILNYIADHAPKYGISSDSIDQDILPEFCNILAYYEIPSTTCNTLP